MIRLLVAAFIPFVVMAQVADSKPTSRGTHVDGAAVSAVNDPAAQALFAKASATQIKGESAFEVRDFQADLEATIYEKDKDTGEQAARSAHLTQFFRFNATSRPSYRSDRFEPLTKKQVTKGFDGNSHWMKLGREPARELIGREDQEDRRSTTNEVNRTTDMLSCLVLRNLMVEGATYHTLGSLVLTPGGKSVRAQGILLRRPKGGLIEIWVVGDDASLVALRRSSDEGSKELLVMSQHRPLVVGSHTISMPYVIESFDGDRLILEARASSTTAIKVNSGIEDAVFSLPR